MDLDAATVETGTQDGHLLAIDTELGKDVLLLTAVDGAETISRGFVYTIEMLTLASDNEVRALLGKPVTLWLSNASEEARRPLHGHVRNLRRGMLDSRGYRIWTAETVPWLWFLTRSVDCRIFQNLSIPEILTIVFGDLGLSQHQFRLIGQYPKLEFCIQYRESAFAFVSRLMEHVGISYWFEHYANRHVLIVSDTNQMASFVPSRQVSLSRSDLGSIQEFAHTMTIRPGIWSLNDYDFEAPKKNLQAREPSILAPHPLSSFEVYDYPGLYTVADIGTHLARLRMEEEEARYHELSGASTCVGFDAGKRFELVPGNSDEEAATYLLTEVRHTARDITYQSGNSEAPTYSNHFVCIPAGTPFRPARLTQKPIVHGPQTATVVGPPGETIFTDQAGRVKLQFHWDRYGKADDKSSCWVRVSQNSAGAGWGGMFIPHVGHEVIVSFLEGDPDRPMVTGRVYNGDNKKSVALPANKTQVGLRDHSGNELQMEGKGGVQNIRLTAVKDMNFNVTHDYNETVQTGNRTMMVNTGTYTEVIKGDTKTTVTTGSLSVVVAANTASFQSQNTMSVTSTTADVHVQAATQIALDVGDSHIVMTKDGTILLNAKNIVMFGSESVTIKSNAIRSMADQEHEIKGAITVSEGVTTNTVKGGMVMLNPGS